MKPCLSFEELIETGRPPLTEMQRVGNAFDDPTTEAACLAFSRQVLFVKATVRQTYGHAARLARKADTHDEAAEVWRKMGAFCGSALQVLASLKDRFPDCGAGELYDLVLDYRTACETRCKRTLEDKACLAMEFPKGLLPKLS
jgi:hypothetical protein